MDARLERELASLAKHVETLEQLASENIRDASFARRARGAAGAAAEAPEPRRKQLGVAPRRARVRLSALSEALARALRGCGVAGQATQILEQLDRDALFQSASSKTPQKTQNEDARAAAASLRRTRDLLARGLDQVAAAAEAIDEDSSLFSGVLGKHSKIGGAVKRAGKAIRSIKTQEDGDLASMVASVCVFYLVVFYIIWRRLPLREVLRWVLSSLWGLCVGGGATEEVAETAVAACAAAAAAGAALPAHCALHEAAAAAAASSVQEAPPPPPAPPDPDPPACVDTAGWHDGKNGCSGYARHADTWCDLYGGTDYNGQGPAAVHCCACGGGATRDEL
jgi:hypothetical protein